jgi:hypothetical protein
MMIPLTAIMIGLLALLTIVLLWTLASSKPRNLEQLASELQPIDVNAFRNLIDEREEQFLRERLTAREFRRIHRERMLAAVDYVRGAAHNAGTLIRLAEAAKSNSDPAVVTAAESLLENALRLRLYSLEAVPRLYLSIFVPQLNPTPRAFAETYATASREMVRLRCLQAPAGGGISGIA